MRLYRVLLHLYPASFRAEYGTEMGAIFQRRLAQASGLGKLALWADTLLEIVFNAIAAHWDILRQDLRYTARTLLRSPGLDRKSVV